MSQAAIRSEIWKFHSLGKPLAAPIFVAPIGLIPYTYTEDMTDRLYCDAVMLGAKAAGILAFGGGGPKAENFYEPLEAIRENGGWGIPTLKPWAVEVVKERLKEVEAVHPFAFAMDIDSAGLPHAGLANPPMLLKTEEERERLLRQPICRLS